MFRVTPTFEDPPGIVRTTQFTYLAAKTDAALDSADPFVRDAADLQALNRYSYVENNPLSYTDPSGYFLKKLVKGIVKAIRTVVSSVVKFERELRRSILRAIGSVEGLSTLVSLALNAIPGCVGWCSAMLQASFSAAMADANGGTISQALKAGAIGFARAGLEQMGGGAGIGGGSGNGQLVFQLDAAAKSMGLERGSSLKDLFVSEAVMRLRVAERKAQANINRSESAKMVQQGKPTTCPSVPTAPPGVNVSDNIDIASDHSALNPGSLYAFFQLVRNGGGWDYKQVGKVPGVPSPYEAFGNFNYGATGNAMGIPGQVLLRAAGGASILAGTSPANSSNPFGQAPYGDSPVDQAWIKKGIEYSRCLIGTGP